MPLLLEARPQFWLKGAIILFCARVECSRRYPHNERQGARRGNHLVNLEVRIPAATISNYLFSQENNIAKNIDFVNPYKAKNQLDAGFLLDFSDFPSLTFPLLGNQI